jgi:hypothetical protein
MAIKMLGGARVCEVVSCVRSCIASSYIDVLIIIRRGYEVIGSLCLCFDFLGIHRLGLSVLPGPLCLA